MVIMQLLEHNILWLNPVGITGCFSTVNQLSQYSAMALPIAYFLHPLLAVIPLFTLIVSGSFIEQTPSGYMAVFVGFIFLAIMRKIKKRDMVIFVLVFIVGLLLTYKHTIAQLIPWFTISRPVSWKTAISYILKKPWLGYGYQSYTEVVKTKVMSLGYYDASANPGSDWLHNIFEFGLPVFIFVIAFFKGLWGKFYNNEQERITYFLVASVIIGLSNMLWQNMIRCAAPGGTFIVLLALLCIKLNEVYPGEVKTKEG
jgi:O-antigen ligase